MTVISRIRVDLGGSAVVGQSVMTFYSLSATTGLPAALTTWLNALKANFPPSLTFTVPNGGDLIEDSDGSLQGVWSQGSGGTVTGTGVGGFLQGTGVRVVWGTNGITGNRRVKGSTFLVPLMGTDFDASGKLQPTSLTALDGPTQTFLTGQKPNLVVWSRPVPAHIRNGVTVPARAGHSSPILTATIPSFVTTLRSRRT